MIRLLSRPTPQRIRGARMRPEQPVPERSQTMQLMEHGDAVGSVSGPAVGALGIDDVDQRFGDVVGVRDEETPAGGGRDDF